MLYFIQNRITRNIKIKRESQQKYVLQLDSLTRKFAKLSKGGKEGQGESVHDTTTRNVYQKT